MPQQQPTTQQPSADVIKAGLIARAIALTENGGSVDINNPRAGQSGEMKSIFQYTPDTWKQVATQIFGKEVPLNSDTETIATVGRVDNWLNKGYSPEQIFSMHNAGIGEPNAYEGKFSDGSPSKGTNKYGVKYDVPGYVKKAVGYLGMGSGGAPSAPGAPASPQPPAAITSAPQQGTPGILPAPGGRGAPGPKLPKIGPKLRSPIRAA